MKEVRSLKRCPWCGQFCKQGIWGYIEHEKVCPNREHRWETFRKALQKAIKEHEEWIDYILTKYQ